MIQVSYEWQLVENETGWRLASGYSSAGSHSKPLIEVGITSIVNVRTFHCWGKQLGVGSSQKGFVGFVTEIQTAYQGSGAHVYVYMHAGTETFYSDVYLL